MCLSLWVTEAISCWCQDPQQNSSVGEWQLTSRMPVSSTCWAKKRRWEGGALNESGCRKEVQSCHLYQQIKFCSELFQWPPFSGMVIISRLSCTHEPPATGDCISCPRWKRNSYHFHTIANMEIQGTALQWLVSPMGKSSPWCYLISSCAPLPIWHRPLALGVTSTLRHQVQIVNEWLSKHCPWRVCQLWLVGWSTTSWN